MVARLLVDPHNPRNLYAAAWSTESGGGVFRSNNGGGTWSSVPALAGQSVRALAMAPGDPRLIVAGALEGVFLSSDSGRSWRRISPENDPEIRNIESLVVDPLDPDVIYAGTWHLPWKTTNGGSNWFSIKSGIVDDSDVFAVTVDWSNRETLFLGACSGIYRSDDAGQKWRKIQGIPSSARRTRTLRLDPRQASVVYAGTTEGLWKSESGGAGWHLVTSGTLIVNDVLIDPADSAHLFLATDRAGILESLDGGKNFAAANQGFSHRQVWRLVLDSGQLTAAVRHDKEYGGVYVSADGNNWQQWNQGLGGRDVLTLAHTPGSQWLAGTPDGLFRFHQDRLVWERTGRFLNVERRPDGETSYSGEPLTAQINDLIADLHADNRGRTLYAATSQGVLRSIDGGEIWMSVSPKWQADRVVSSGILLMAGTPEGIQISNSGGDRWQLSPLPEYPAPVNGLVLTGQILYAATDRGLFRSPNRGGIWQRHGHGIPLGPVSDVLVDPADPTRVYVASSYTHTIYLSTDGGQTYAPLPDGGFMGRQPRRLVLGPQGKLYLASGYDGVFVLEDSRAVK